MTTLDMAAYRAMTDAEKIQTLTHWHEVAAEAIERQHAEIVKYRTALEAVEAHHIEQNRLKGRDESRSHTLSVVRAALRRQD